VASEGLGKRLKRTVLRAVKLCVLSFVILAATVCIQAYLLEGPEALSHVHLDLIRMMGALKQAIGRVVSLLLISIQKARSGQTRDHDVEFYIAEDSVGMWGDDEQDDRP
jgi:hypothetical protein